MGQGSSSSLARQTNKTKSDLVRLVINSQERFPSKFVIMRMHYMQRIVCVAYNNSVMKTTNMDIDQIKDKINKNTDFLRNAYHVTKIGIFGSVARGENFKTGDIDVLVEFSEPIGFFKFIELEEFLSKILGKKVDLVTKKALKEAIREEVLREVIYV